MDTYVKSPSRGAASLQPIRFRMDLVQTQSQKELVIKLKQVCVTETGLWHRFEQDASIENLFLIVQHYDDGYAFTQKEEARLQAALEAHLEDRGHLLKTTVSPHARIPDLPVQNLVMPDVVEKGGKSRPAPPEMPTKKPPQTAEEDAPSRAYVETAGEHECLVEIVDAVRGLPPQAQVRRWELLVIMSGVGAADKDSFYGRANVHNSTLKDLERTSLKLKGQSEKAATETESVALVLDNMKRHTAKERIQLWRDLRGIAHKKA